MKCLKNGLKIFSLILLIFFAFSFCGCSPEGETNIDTTVNMTPRKIVSSASLLPDVVSDVKPAVVGISAVYGGFESVGSGVSIAPDGYIVTNSHVVNGANNLTVYFANKTSAKANLIWEDANMDLAIIKTNVNIPYLETETNVSVGEDVIAIGTPLTLQFKHTTTKGIVSALNRTIELEGEDGAVNYMQNLIQHDASINPGNSGGPLINSSGKVIGINSLKVTDAEGLGFAIPISVVIPVVNNIIKYGKYETPYLGVLGFDADIASFYGKTIASNGVYINEIDVNSPIYSAGIRKGDIITQFGDFKINSMTDLRSSVYNYLVGSNIKVSYVRNGSVKSTNVVLSKRP